MTQDQRVDAIWDCIFLFVNDENDAGQIRRANKYSQLAPLLDIISKLIISQCLCLYMSKKDQQCIACSHGCLPFLMPIELGLCPVHEIISHVEGWASCSNDQINTREGRWIFLEMVYVLIFHCVQLPEGNSSGLRWFVYSSQLLWSPELCCCDIIVRPWLVTRWLPWLDSSPNCAGWITGSVLLQTLIQPTCAASQMYTQTHRIALTARPRRHASMRVRKDKQIKLRIHDIQLQILIHIERRLTGNNDVLHSICLYLFYVLSMGFRVPLYEDYGTLKSKCPCLTWLKWLLLFASWVRPHFTISERCPGRHKTNEKAKVFKGRGYERRECSMMCQSLGTPRLLCMYSISFCLLFVQLCEAIRNPRVQAFSFKYTTNGC